MIDIESLLKTIKFRYITKYKKFHYSQINYPNLKNIHLRFTSQIKMCKLHLFRLHEQRTVKI